MIIYLFSYPSSSQFSTNFPCIDSNSFRAPTIQFDTKQKRFVGFILTAVAHVNCPGHSREDPHPFSPSPLLNPNWNHFRLVQFFRWFIFARLKIAQQSLRIDEKNKTICGRRQLSDSTSNQFVQFIKLFSIFILFEVLFNLQSILVKFLKIKLIILNKKVANFSGILSVCLPLPRCPFFMFSREFGQTYDALCPPFPPLKRNRPDGQTRWTVFPPRGNVR